MQVQSELPAKPSNPKVKNGIKFFPLDGGTYHVFDPTTSRHFRMGQQEVAWLQLLDGNRSKEALREHIPQEYFEGFLVNTTRLELLEGLQASRKLDIFKLKFPVNNPNQLLDRMGKLTLLYRVLLNRLSAFLLVLNLMGLVMLGPKALDSMTLTHFNPWMIPFYVAAILVMGFCHEASHSIVAKSYGVNVPAVGIMLFYLHPSFYADVSGIRLLRRQGERINVLLAGVMANNLLVSAALFFYFVLPSGFSSYLLYFVWINVIVVIINLIPFVEYDGHYLLQELLNETNLASKAKQSLQKGAARRAEYLIYFVFSQAFSLALISTIFLALRRYALRLTHWPYVDHIFLLLMIGAFVAFARRQARNPVKT